MVLKTIIVILISLNFSKAQFDRVRMTQYGPICGKILTSRANSKIEYLSFKGVQYAAPPLGKLRFKEPQPPLSWTRTRSAFKDRQVCMQFDPANGTNVIGSEDCLYLDVFVPITAANNLKKMPVMVWIHEGNWVAGSISDTGPDYLMEKPIVIVLIEYRLSVFGFLTTLDENAKGNYGLKDQVQALKWVQTNIANFNGDPSRVTIGGNANGGISVIYHMLSPLSKGLFSGGISQTGNPLNGASLQRNPLEHTKRLVKALNINSTDNAEIVEQLQAIDAETLYRTAQNFSVVGYYYIPYDSQPYEPVIERKSNTSFLSESPIDLLQSGNYTKVPLIMGHNSQEAEVIWAAVENGQVDISLYQTDPQIIIPEFMNIPEDSPCINTTLNNITKRYFPDGNYTNPYEWIPYMSLDIFVLGILEAAKYLQKEIPIYYYYLSYVGSRNTAYLRPRGVPHHEELLYLWYPQDYGANPNESDKDKLTRERVVTLWTNFAYKRNPTPKTEKLLQNVKWPTINSKQSYLNINSTLKIRSPIPHLAEMSFWYRQYNACRFPVPNPNNA